MQQRASDAEVLVLRLTYLLIPSMRGKLIARQSFKRAVGCNGYYNLSYGRSRYRSDPNAEAQCTPRACLCAKEAEFHRERGTGRTP